MVKNSRLHVGAHWRWDGTLAFSLGLITVMVPTVVGAQAIRADGRTATSISVNGAVTDIRTTSVQGANAFNSFSTFNVPAATVANLHVPTGATNLINLVRDERSSIDGVLNAIKDGSIGGNVWFANPYGLVVGAKGTVNVGTLNVSTPTPQFVNNFFQSSGTADPTALNSLMTGAAPINPDGLVSIQGTVNAANGVNLTAGTVNVGGTVFAGARFLGAAPDFSDVVNANGIRSASNVLVEGGRIRIQAQGDVTVGGTLAAPGATGVKAGDINIHAGGNVDLQSGAQLVARGNGENSAGGTIVSWADNNAVNRKGSLLDASAGTSGAGGSVEFSAKNTVELAGGELRADGTGGGAAGSVLVDPSDIIVQANMLRGDSSYTSGQGTVSGVNSADLTLTADRSIEVAADVVISSRSVAVSGTQSYQLDHQNGTSTGNSGNITLQAPSIVLHKGSALLANVDVDGHYTAGNITLTAGLQAKSDLVGTRDADVSIQIGDDAGGATLKGKDVTLSASTTVDTLFYYSGSQPVESSTHLETTSLDKTALVAKMLAAGGALVGIDAVISQSTGKSSVVVRGTSDSNSVIDGTGNVTLEAKNVVSSGVTPVFSNSTAGQTPGGTITMVPTPLGVGVLYASTTANATVDVQSTATIKGVNLSVNAHNDAMVLGAIKGGSQLNPSDQLSIAFGYAAANVDASATIAKGATIDSTGVVSVQATNYNKFANKVTSVTGAYGVASAAVAWSDFNTRANASLQADVGSAKQVEVVAVDHVVSDQTSANAAAGTTWFDNVQNGLMMGTSLGQEKGFFAAFNMNSPKVDGRANPYPTPFRIGGAIAYVDSTHSASASIGDGAKIHVSDAKDPATVLVAARTIGENTAISAESAASSPSMMNPADPMVGSPSRINVSAGLAFGNYEHDASAVIGSGAEITAEHIALMSDVSLPVRPSVIFGNAKWNFDRWDGVNTFGELANTLEFRDVMNGASSASVAGTGGIPSMGFSGSANIMNFKQKSTAEVKEGATLNIYDGFKGGFAYTFTLRDATPDTYSADHVLLVNGESADVQSWTVDAPVTVQADTTATLLFQAGAPERAIANTGSYAVGFSLNQIQVSSNTEAVVRENVTIQSIGADATASATPVDEVRVRAQSAEKVYSFGVNAGMAATGGNPIVANGIISVVGVNNQTIASVDDESSIAARKLVVNSTDESIAWSIAGAINYSSSAAVGIGLAINDVTTKTQAEIGDNDTVALDGSTRDSADSFTGAIESQDLSVEARTSGHVEAIGIAGSASNAGPPATGYLGSIQTKLGNAVSSLSTYFNTLTRGNATGSPASPTMADPVNPTFGLSGAGSAAVNTTHMQTSAHIDASTLTNSASTPTHVSVLAINDTDISAAAGAAALTRAGLSSQTRSVGISGAIAVNVLGNGTEAVIDGSSITGFKDVDVQALTGGEHLSVAIGAAVTVSGATPNQSSLAAAGSMSFTFSEVDANGNSQNFAKAQVKNSIIEGHSTTDGNNVTTADGDLHVTAYDRTFVGTGGGSLSLGGQTGFGAAVTFTDMRNDVDARISDGSKISTFVNATVHATSATEIGAGGASLSASASTGSEAMAGAIVLTQVHNTTNAEISGKSSVSVDQNIEVQATDAGADNALEAVMDPSGKRANVAPGLDYCGAQVVGGGNGSCITSVAGLLQANVGKNSSNVGISYVQNLISNTVSAKVEDAALTATDTSGAVRVLANSSNQLKGFALGAGVATKFAGAGSVVVNKTENNVSASISAPSEDTSYKTVTAANITVRATDASSIESVAGQIVASSDQVAVGGAVAYNEINNGTGATADGVNLKATQSALIKALLTDATIKSISAAGAFAGEFAFSESISVNHVSNWTRAQVYNGSTITDGVDGTVGSQQVIVAATDNSSIQSLAGNVDGGKVAAVGGALAANVIENDTFSAVIYSTVTVASKLDVSSNQNASIRSLSAAAGNSTNGFGGVFEGSLSENFIGNNTSSLLLGTGVSGSAANVTLRSHDTSTIEAASGGAAVAQGTLGVGIAASINRISNKVDAGLVGDADTNVGNLEVSATSDATIDTVAVALGVGRIAGVGGSNATNLMDNTTQAHIGDDARVSSANNVGVFAENNDQVKVIAGAAAFSPYGGGVGISVVVNTMDGSTEASIDGAATKVDAAGGGSQTMTVNDGSLVTPADLNAVLSPKYTHADLTETTHTMQGLAVTATSHQSVITNAETLGLAAEVGGSVTPVVNILGGSTKSYITEAQVGTRLTTLFSPEVYVNASSQTYVASFVTGGAGGGTFAASAALATNLLERKTYAYISSANTGIATVQTEELSRDTQSELQNFDSTSGAPIFNESTTITQSKKLVPTLGQVTVHAEASQSAANVVAGAAGSSIAVAASGVVNRFSADTQAHVEGGTVVSGGLDVDASTASGYNALVGAGAIGGVSVGASFAVGIANNNTKAWVGDPNASSNTTALYLTGDLLVDATTTNTMNSVVVSGTGAGTYAVAGMADVTLLNNTTVAGVYRTTAGDTLPTTPDVSQSSSNAGNDSGGTTTTTTVTQDYTASGKLSQAMGNVKVRGTEHTNIGARAGVSSAGGITGIGAAANVVVVKSQLTAEVLDSEITTPGSVSDRAYSFKDAALSTGTSALSFENGIGGAVGVLLMGEKTTSETPLSATIAQVSTAAKSVPAVGSTTGISDVESERLKGIVYDVESFVGSNGKDSITARLESSTVKASAVNLTASAEITTENTAGVLAVSGALSVGGSVGFTRIYDNVQAKVLNSTLESPTVQVEALVVDLDGAALKVHAYGGSAGSIGLGAAVADGTIDNTVESTLSGNVDGGVGSTNAVLVSAQDLSTAQTRAVGATIGAEAAVGVVISNAHKESTVTAQTGSGSMLIDYQSIELSAEESGAVSSEAWAGSGGVAAGSGAHATGMDASSVTAQASGTLSASDAVSIHAVATPQVSAKAAGFAVAVLGVGTSLAEATASPNVKAAVEASAVVDGKGTLADGKGTLAVVASIEAPTDSDSARAETIAGTGTAVGVDASISQAKSDGSVVASVGDGVTLGGGNILIAAKQDTRQFAIATGVAVGALAVGVSQAEASSSGNVEAKLGANALMADTRIGALSIIADGTDDNAAQAIAGAGALLAGSAAKATTSDNTNIKASIAGSDTSTDLYGGNFLLHASHQDISGHSASSINAALIGGSGVESYHSAASTVETSLGNNLAIYAAGQVQLESANAFDDGTMFNTAEGAAGGVFSGSAAKSNTSLTGVSRTVLGDNVSINSGTDPINNPGGISITASNWAGSSDQATMSTGGLIAAGAGVESSLRATLSNEVTVGAHDTLSSMGNIGVGSWTQTDVSSTANVSTWGSVLVAGSATSRTNVTANQNVTIGANAVLSAFGNVNVTAGKDMLGTNDTALTGASDAEGYVQGIIAVPVASAHTSLDDNASVSIGDAAEIKSGLNVDLGAYTGTPAAHATAHGRGYELFFIPVDNGHSGVNTPTTSIVDINGTVTAGAFHKLDILIVGNTLTSNPDAAPFLYEYDETFSTPEYIKANYGDNSTQAGLLASGTSASPVGAFRLGALYASAGNATIQADTLTGTGTVTAYGSPSISVLNNSENYLLFNSATIPNLSGGKVIFTGAAGAVQAQRAGLTMNEIGASGTPSITLSNIYDKTVGDGQFGTAMFQEGNIENLGGNVQINVAAGSLGQTGTTYGQQVNISVPHGVVVISDTNAVHYAGSNPYSEWQNYMVWPGGNPAANAGLDANEAVSYAINAMYNKNGQYTTAYDLTKSIIRWVGASNNYSTVFFGNCASLIWGMCSSTAANNGSSLGQSYEIGTYHSTSGSRSLGFFPMIPVKPVTITGSYAVANLNGSQKSSIAAGLAVSIVADTIDVNGPINVGQATQWSVDLSADLVAPLAKKFNKSVPDSGGAITNFQADYDAAMADRKPLKTSKLKLTLNAQRAGDSVISATYDAQTQEITLNDVSATSGGGYLGITGKIISTNPLGQLHVNGGQGDVQIYNDTGKNLVLNQINTGNTAQAAGQLGTIEIIDKNRAADANHWLYTYSPTTGMSTFHGAESQSKQDLLATTPEISSAASKTFRPVDGMVWQWSEKTELARTYNPNGPFSDWTFSNPSIPWQYVDEMGNVRTTKDKNGHTISDPTTPYGYLLFGQTQTSDFSQTFTATNIGFDVVKSGTFSDITGFSKDTVYSKPVDGLATWTFKFPTHIGLKMTNSVKASNPIAVDFSGNTEGAVRVYSNAPVKINRALINPTGRTDIDVLGGGIAETSTGSILTKELSLGAERGIGSADRPLRATLSDGGYLDVMGGSEGVYLDINSAALVDRVVSLTDSSYGDVVIHAANSLNTLLLSSRITGNNITLTSDRGSIGSETTPFQLNAHSTTLASGLVTGGVVNIKAQDDIGINQVEGDLYIGSIASTAGGNVFVKVSNGTVYGAAGQTASQALSDEQVKKVWQDLHLTEADGAETGKATDASVVHFQDQVNSRYQQYWRLLKSGSVSDSGTGSGKVYTLKADQLPLYRALTAAMTNTANPSDQQVQDFANSQYQSVTGALQSMVGTGWANVADNFVYVASSDQVKERTARAVWDEGRLKSFIHGSALQASVPVGVGNPNITGRDVKLVTSGGIGNLAAPMLIPLKDLQDGTLTQDQMAALAQAEVPGTVVGVDGNGVAVGSGTQPVAFRVQQTAPVFINASGKFSAQAGAQTYVQSTGQSITLDQIVAGGDVSVAAPQSILNAGTSATQIVTPGDVTLLAGGGSIGSADAPLSIQAGRLLAAFAGGDAYLQGLGGDFVVGRVAAGGTASLDAVDGSLESNLDGLAVSGGSVVLHALKDIGAPDHYLQVEVGAGKLDGTAGGAAYIEAPNAASTLSIGSLSTDADLYIAALGDLSAEQLQSNHGVVSVAAGGDLTVGTVTSSVGNIDLLAGQELTIGGAVTTDSGALNVSGASVDMGTAGALVSATNSVKVNATGNVYVHHIVSGMVSGDAVQVVSTAGRIVGSDATGRSDIVATQFGAKVLLDARDGIGDATRVDATSLDKSTPNALEVQAKSLSATSTEGGIQVHSDKVLNAENINAMGAVNLTAVGAIYARSVTGGASVDMVAANGPIRVDSVQAQGDVSVTTIRDISGLSGQRYQQMVSLAGQVSLNSLGGVVIGNVTQAGGDIHLRAAQGVDQVTVQAGTALDIAAGNVLVTSTSAGSDTNIQATNGALQIGSASAGGLLSIQGQSGIKASSLNTTGAGGVTAMATRGDIQVTSINSAGTADLTANFGNVKVDTLQARGNIKATASKGIGGLSATRYQRVESLSGRVDLQAQGGAIAGNLTKAGTDIRLRATGNADLSVVQARNALDVAAAQVNMDLASAGSTAGIVATSGALQAGRVMAGGLLNLQGATGINAFSVSSNIGGAVVATAATGDIQIPNIGMAGTVDLTAKAGNVKVDNVMAQGDVKMTASRGIGGAGVGVYQSVESMGGSVDLQAQGGDVFGHRTKAGRNLNVLASGNVELAIAQAGAALAVQGSQVRGGTVTAGTSAAINATTGDVQFASINSGGSADLTANFGDVKFDTVQAQGNVQVTAGRGIGGWSAAGYQRVESVAGNAGLQAQGDVVGSVLSAAQGDATVSSATGQVLVQSIAGSGVLVYAKDINVVDGIDVGRRLVLEGDTVDQAVRHNGIDQPLQVSLSGPNQTAMSHANLTITSPVGVRFEHLKAADATIQSSAASVEVADGYIDRRMSVSNPSVNLVMDNTSTVPIAGVDIQLFSSTKSFGMQLNGNRIDTQGANVVAHNPLTTEVGGAGTQSSSIPDSATAALTLAMQSMQPPVVMISQVNLLSGGPLVLLRGVLPVSAPVQLVVPTPPPVVVSAPAPTPVPTQDLVPVPPITPDPVPVPVPATTPDPALLPATPSDPALLPATPQDPAPAANPSDEPKV